MGFDLRQLIDKATQFTEDRQSGQGFRGPKLVYPGPGLLRVKLLYNPKSNLVARQIRRHRVNNVSTTCLSIYNMECPICKSVDSIQNVTGIDLWKFKAKNRGISYAQYVGSKDYKWGPGDEPEVGELILLMYPWTIYQDINRIIASAGPQADKLIALNEGKVINISRWNESGQVKYKGEVDAFSPDFKSKDNDDDFVEFLNNLPNLNEAMAPPVATQELIKIVSDLSESLNRDYLRRTGTSFPTQQSGQQPSEQSDQQVQNINPQQQTTPISGTQASSRFTAPDGSVFEMIDGKYVMVSGPTTPPAQQPTSQPTPPWTDPTGSNETNNPASDSNPSMMTGDDVPVCMGKHVDGDPKCLACRYEMQCMMTKQ